MHNALIKDNKKDGEVIGAKYRIRNSDRLWDKELACSGHIEDDVEITLKRGKILHSVQRSQAMSSI